MKIKEPRIKVLRIISRLNIGGPSIHVINLNKGLDKKMFQSLLLCGDISDGEKSMLNEAKKSGIKLMSIPELTNEHSLKLKDLKALLKIYLIIKKYKPEIVHTHTAKAGLIGRIAAHLALTPKIIHTYHGHVLHGYFSKPKTYLLRLMEKFLALITDSLIVVSDKIKTELINYKISKPAKFNIIKLGFNLNPFLNNHHLKNKLKENLELPYDSNLIGIVGRMVPIKNHKLFIEAASQIIAKKENTYFLIVGDGPLRKSIENLTYKLNINKNTFFTGWRNDLPLIYASLDILVCSSDNEGTSVSVIEAMASGCPVVTTSVGGHPDIIDEGNNGYLIEPQNTDTLANKILEILNNPNKSLRLGENARTDAKNNFSYDRLINDVQKHYKKLLIGENN
tara:strand:+ start:16294 stop:17475 length:1182 start_codon:yes stop_codon:yes gene_type:complete